MAAREVPKFVSLIRIFEPNERIRKTLTVQTIPSPLRNPHPAHHALRNQLRPVLPPPQRNLDRREGRLRGQLRRRRGGGVFADDHRAAGPGGRERDPGAGGALVGGKPDLQHAAAICFRQVAQVGDRRLVARRRLDVDVSARECLEHFPGGGEAQQRHFGLPQLIMIIGACSWIIALALTSIIMPWMWTPIISMTTWLLPTLRVIEVFEVMVMSISTSIFCV